MPIQLTRQELIERLEHMEIIKQEILRRNVEDNPMRWGLPDLLFPQGYKQGRLDRETGEVIREKLPHHETEEQYKARQNACLKSCVERHIWFEKDGEHINITLIPAMVRLLSDLFFRRVNKVILWGNRGSGKSLLAAVCIWLMNVYHKQSFLNLAGSGEQAKRVYEYTKQFWGCKPGLADAMLKQRPLMSETRRVNGSVIVCAESSGKAVGKHHAGFVADESCTDNPKADHAILRAMQGAFSEDNYVVFLLSTFHHPVGMFQEVWDDAEARGFEKYKWTTYDTMARCDAGLETATKDDPQALQFCHRSCPLTRLEDVYDEFGRKTGKRWIGCQGKARTSQGWETREKVLEKFYLNRGTRVFRVEHECHRPAFEGLIYNPTIITRCKVPGFDIDINDVKTIGIDWGLTQCAMAMLSPWKDSRGLRGIGLLGMRFMSNELTQEVLAQIQYWQEQFGDRVVIRADASHPYCNKELREAGYKVRTVKGDPKRVAETNLQRWISSGLFLVYADGDGIPMWESQMKNLQRNLATGKQKKKNTDDEHGDHGPDATKFGMMNYDFIKWRRNLIDEGIIDPGFGIDLVEKSD